MQTSNNYKTYLLVTGNLLACLVLVFGAMAFPSSERVAVFVSPWSPQHKVFGVVATAQGNIVSAGKKDWVAVAQSDEPDFISRLYRSGALLVLNANFATACLPREFFRKNTI